MFLARSWSLSLLFAALSFAPSLAQTEGQLGRLEAETKTIEADGSSSFEGNFRFVYPGRLLVTADKARYFPEENRFEIEGDVKLDYQSELGLIEVTAQYFYYDIERGSGHLLEVAVNFGDEFFFRGERFEMIDPAHFVIEDGRITACNQPIPQWSLEMRHALIEREGYAVVRGAVFRLKRLPLLYLPYVVIPAMTKRKSGLLAPKTGSSQRNGSYYAQPFYWAPRQDMDFTFTPAIYDKAGLTLDVEARYHFTGDYKGELQSRLIEDRVVSRLADEGRPPLEGGKPIEDRRYRVEWEHYQPLLKGDLTAEVNTGSDFFVDRDYIEDPRQSRLRDYYIRGRYDQSVGEDTLTLRVDKLDRIMTGAETITEVDALPELRYFQPTRHVGGGFYLRSETRLSWFRFNELGPDAAEGELLRLGLDGELSRTAELGKYLHLRYGLVYRGAHFRPDEGGGETRGGGFGFTELAGPRLQRVYNWGEQRLVNYLDTSVRLSYGTHEEDAFLENVLFDDFDIRMEEQADGLFGEWRVNSRFFLGQSGSLRPFLDLEIRQNVDLDVDEEDSRDSRPINSRFRLLNLRGFNVNGILEYDPETSKLETLSIYGSVRRGSWQGYAGYVKRDQVDGLPQDSLIAITKLELPYWRSSIQVDAEYDFENSRFKSQELKYGYVGQCVSIFISYFDSPFNSSRDDRDQFVQLMFSLRNLGELGTRL